jgi:anti-anti-sigma factor
MELTRIDQSDAVEIRASGRLDEHWAGHLSEGLDAVIRTGSHRIRLNLSSVSYISSAGIRVLVTFSKQLGELGGSFEVIEPSPMVRKVLDLTRLTPMLMGVTLAGAPEAPRSSIERLECENSVYEIHERVAAGFDCRIIGDPDHLSAGGYRKEHARATPFDRNSVGLGLGAFGSDFEDCSDRYGEFLAAGGTAIYLPTDGSTVPDHLAAAEDFVPQVSVLYGLACHGHFAAWARFEALEHSRPVALSEIAGAALDIAKADTAVVVLVAEAAGLVGASLRRPPTNPAAGLFEIPAIRQWISFTSDPAFGGSLCLVAGVVSRETSTPLRKMLRPLSRRTKLAGHFHAAAFPYQPLKKGRLDLSATVNGLFDREIVQGLLHLLADERERSGAGESEFLRGACWAGPIRKIEEA